MDAVMEDKTRPSSSTLASQCIPFLASVEERFYRMPREEQRSSQIEWARVSYSKKDELFTLSLTDGTTEQHKMTKRAATVLLTSLAEAIAHLHDDQPPTNC